MADWVIISPEKNLIDSHIVRVGHTPGMTAAKVVADLYKVIEQLNIVYDYLGNDVWLVKCLGVSYLVVAPG